MLSCDYRFALELSREDGTSLAQEPVEVDWAPAAAWARLQALREDPGCAAPEAARLEPVWLASKGEPYLAGVRIEVRTEAGVVRHSALPNAYFSDVAEQASARLVEAGRIEAGDRFSYRALAFPRGAQSEPAAPFRVRRSAPSLRIATASLAERLAAAGQTARHPASPQRMVGDEGSLRAPRSSSGRYSAMPEDELLPVLLPRRVIDEAAQQTRLSPDHETGGVLVGHLQRDPDGTLFAEVTAQLPARHTRAEAMRLTFTPETWTDVRSALELRRRDELLLGWWHSHPARHWCGACPEERRRVCALRQGFLSGHDRLLHRTVFPAAWSVALVMTDTDEQMQPSLFGWHAGRLQPRGCHLVGPGEDACLAAPAADPVADAARGEQPCPSN